MADDIDSVREEMRERVNDRPPGLWLAIQVRGDGSFSRQERSNIETTINDSIGRPERDIFTIESVNLLSFFIQTHQQQIGAAQVFFFEDKVERALEDVDGTRLSEIFVMTNREAESRLGV